MTKIDEGFCCCCLTLHVHVSRKRGTIVNTRSLSVNIQYLFVFRGGLQKSGLSWHDGTSP
jgi:hypothetical protein